MWVGGDLLEGWLGVAGGDVRLVLVKMFGRGHDDESLLFLKQNYKLFHRNDLRLSNWVLNYSKSVLR